MFLLQPVILHKSAALHFVIFVLSKIFFLFFFFSQLDKAVKRRPFSACWFTVSPILSVLAVVLSVSPKGLCCCQHSHVYFSAPPSDGLPHSHAPPPSPSPCLPPYLELFNMAVRLRETGSGVSPFWPHPCLSFPSAAPLFSCSPGPFGVVHVSSRTTSLEPGQSPGLD